MFTTGLAAHAIINGAKIHERHDIRKFSQGSSRVAILAQWRAKRDARAATTKVHPPQEDMEKDIAPEALEVPHEEMQTTASTPCRKREKERGYVARGGT
jgi:hypothetical protein